VESGRNLLEPVEGASFSTGGIHGANGLPVRDRAVFPLVHTPYDFYERI
jgi:hypothetical protein